jgi:hypothetical protein
LDHRRVASDQGTALCSICQQHQNDHFFCLRHFLHSLKRQMWSEEIGNLTGCRAPDSFGLRSAECRIRFSRALEIEPTSPALSFPSPRGGGAARVLARSFRLSKQSQIASPLSKSSNEVRIEWI